MASRKAYCDYGLMVGASIDNAASIAKLAGQAAGLKMYLNDTFTTLRMDSVSDWSKHFDAWPKNSPLCVHAEGRTTAAAILMAALHDRPLHVCHVARREEIEVIRAAKTKGLPITCEVSPHHLFLCEEDIGDLGPNKSEVRPVLVTRDDQQALWDNLDIIDCIASDHAPHTLAEKLGERPPPGFPGLETMLPLMLTAVNEGRLSLADIEDKMYHNPRRIFGLPEQPNTYIEVDMDEEWTIPERPAYSKAGWTPFAGRKVTGSVRRVMLRGETAFVDGKVLARPGFGQDVRVWSSNNLGIGGFKTALPPPPMPAIRRQVWDDEQAGRRNRTDSGRYDSGGHTSGFRGRNESGQQREGGLQLGHMQPLVATGRPCSPYGGVLSPNKTSANDLEAVQAVDKLSVQLPGGIVQLSAAAAAPNNSSSHSWINRHVLKVSMFDKEALTFLFDLTDTYRTCVKKERPISHILQGKLMASVFYEASTRTACSFAAAMERLGGRVIYSDETKSSHKKGESLEDSIQVLASYSDVVVLRHPTPGAVASAARNCKKPVINAGDGIGEHPTQALLDAYTIREEIGTVNGLTITMVGDLKHGRTVHSLARLLTMYNVRLRSVWWIMYYLIPVSYGL